MSFDNEAKRFYNFPAHSILLHAVYNKRSRTSKTYLAHAPEGSCKMGDVVELKPVAPMSKRKRFAVGKVVEPSL